MDFLGWSTGSTLVTGLGIKPVSELQPEIDVSAGISIELIGAGPALLVSAVLGTAEVVKLG